MQDKHIRNQQTLNPIIPADMHDTSAQIHKPARSTLVLQKLPEPTRLQMEKIEKKTQQPKEQEDSAQQIFRGLFSNKISDITSAFLKFEKLPRGERFAITLLLQRERNNPTTNQIRKAKLTTIIQSLKDLDKELEQRQHLLSQKSAAQLRSNNPKTSLLSTASKSCKENKDRRKNVMPPDVKEVKVPVSPVAPKAALAPPAKNVSDSSSVQSFFSKLGRLLSWGSKDKKQHQNIRSSSQEQEEPLFNCQPQSLYHREGENKKIR